MAENKIKQDSTYQNLSSTTLFNFTDSYSHLVSNLENGFYCGELYEKLPLKPKAAGYRVAMVCFCDIPLGQIKEHLGWYGNFAIGIRREYARTHGINPVWYMHTDNIVLKKMRQHYKLNDVKGYINDHWSLDTKGFFAEEKRISNISSPYMAKN